MSYPATKASRLVSPLLAGLIACALPICTLAQNAKNRVTAQMNQPFSLCLDTLSRAANVTVKWDTALLKSKLDVPPLVQMSVTDLPFDQALQRLLARARTPLTFHRVNGIYLIQRDPTRKINVPPPLPNEGHGTITSVCTRVPFEEALDNLFKGEGIRYRIEPSVEATDEPVSYEVNHATIDEALKALLAAVPGQKSPLGYRVENGVYILSQNQAEGKVSEVEVLSVGPTVNLELKHATLDAALNALFKQAHFSYFYLPPTEVTGDITLSLKNVPANKALAKILRSVDVSPPIVARRRDDVFLIARDVPSPAANEAPNRPVVTLYLDDVTLYTALKSLFSLTERQYTLDPSLRNQKVTCAFRAIPVRTALEALLRQAHPRLTYQVENGIYSIIPAAP